MAPGNPSMAWQKLEEVYYSIHVCYDQPEWDLEDIYLNYRVKILPNGTLLAVALRFVPRPNVITIYSLSGTKLWTLVYNLGGSQDHIADFAFAGERLCVVLANKKIRVYTDLEGTFDEYSCTDHVSHMVSTSPESERGQSGFKHVITNLEDDLLEEVSPLAAAEVWGEWLVLRYPCHVTFVSTTDFSVHEAAFPAWDTLQVHGMCVVLAEPLAATCLVSYAHTVYTMRCDFAKLTYEVTDERLTEGPFVMMAPLANGRLVALMNAQRQRAFITTALFDQMLLEYDLSNESSVPYMMQWAGSDALILLLRDEIKLVGPGQKLVLYFYDIVEHQDLAFERPPSGTASLAFTVPFIATRADGVTIVTSKKAEFLGRVPQASVDAFQVGSTSPACVLLDCVEKLQRHASKADASIELLRSEGLLRDAVDGCLNAALEEFSPPLQKTLLQAASFGKIYVPGGYDADAYVRAVNTVRVLNYLRSPDVAVFLTHAELVAAGWPAVVDMLLRRSRHYIALNIVRLLRLHDCTPAIYIHWCCLKIRSERSMSDLALFHVIARKLLSAQPKTGTPGRNLIATSEIFDVALQEGRLDLCKLLVSLEPSPAHRVAMLLKINEPDLALIKSFQACDYDLCVLLLRHLKLTLSPAAFQRVLSQTELVEVLAEGSVQELAKDPEIGHLFREKLFVSGNLIGNLWKESTAKNDPELLEEYYKNNGKSADLGQFRLQAYLEQKLKADDSTEFTDLYHSQKRELSRLAESKKLRLIVQTEISTLELRYKLSNTFQQSFFGERSVIDIVSKLIKMHQLKPAAKVIKEFKIPQAKFWNLVLDLYCHSKDFDRLNKFIVESNSNVSVFKAPIGFQTIVETCLAFECPKHYVSTYISHCAEISYSEKVRLYMRNGDMILAAEEAFNNKDVELLYEIQNGLAPEDANVLDAIKSYLNRLGV